MKLASFAVIVLCLLAAPAWAGTIWSFGVDNNNNSDFENEGNADDLFYAHPGDYTATNGYNVATGLFDLAGVNRTTAEAVIDAGSTTEGFERALVGLGDERALNIYFQLGAGPDRQELRFVTELIQLGGGSRHDLAFFLNGQQFYSLAGITGDRRVDLTFDSWANDGSNVLSIVRTGGLTPTDTNPWIQFDFVTLETVVPEPATMALLAMAVSGLAGYIRRRR